MDDNTMLTPTPDEKWSLAHLGEFCVQRFGKMAIDAWWIGKAMLLAKKKAGISFTAWKAEHGFSDSMASRYMRLCEAYKSPELLEGKRIYPALEEAGIPTRPSKSESALAAPLSASHTGDASTEAALSWAIPDDADEEVPQCSSLDGPISEPCPVAALREHVEVALPFAIEQLMQAIDTLIASDKSLDGGVWSAAIVKSLRSQLAALRKKIDELEAHVLGESRAGATSQGPTDRELAVLESVVPEGIWDEDDHSLSA